MHILSQKTIKYPMFQVYILGDKAWTQSRKREQRQLKERRSEYLRIVEPIQHVTKMSHTLLLFQFGEPEEKDQIDGENKKPICRRAVLRRISVFPLLTLS